MFQTARRLDSYRGAASEDRAEIVPLADGALTLIIADGVGGRAGGGTAASLVVATVRDLASDPPAGMRTGRADFWVRALVYADTLLADDPEAGETTCAVAQLSPDGRIVGASVGDSEAWLIALDGGVTDLTAGGRRKPYLGHGMARPAPFVANGGPGATLLLATDGLFKYAAAERITLAALLPDLDGAAARLIELARPPASGALPDDVAVLLCRFP